MAFSKQLYVGIITALLIGGESSLFAAHGAEALTPAAQRGRNLVLNNCARCHAVDKVSPSPLSVAPPFRTLHLRYPIEDLEEPLVEGIITGHPSMPEFRFDPDQANDVIAYMKSLEQ